MKILITQETDWIQRNPIQPHHLAELLSLRGHEIRVIDYELQWMAGSKLKGHSRRQVFENTHKIYHGAKVTVIRPGIVRFPVLDYLSLLSAHNDEIKYQLAEFRPDVIVGFGILNSYLASRAVAGTAIPFIYYWVDVLHLLIPLKLLRPIGVWFEKRAIRRSDIVLTINERLRQVVADLGVPDYKAIVLPTGIDTRRFVPAPPDATLSAKLGLQDEDTILFFMGWLYEFSGLTEVALQLTEPGNENIKLIVVGEGDLYDELLSIQREYHLQDRLILLGKRPYEEIPGLISLADICLLPAYPGETIMQDIVPLKLYEYMAMEKPVIATRFPGIMREFDEDHGIVYVDTPEQVMAKARELIAQDRIVRLGRRAREFVSVNSWDKIADDFESILEQTIEKRKNLK
jgi:glycosyltransferase involved in cell wall biosynthesis